MIIVRGRNYHPEDIEQTVNQAHASFVPGACAAFSVADVSGERLVVVQEILDNTIEPSAEAIRIIFQAASIAVAEKHGIQLSELALIPRRTIHKTGSGKISRRNNYKAWKSGTLQVLHHNKVANFLTKDAPKTATEQELAKVWERLLEVENVERSSDFMEYGGDSIAVVELSAAIKEQFDFLVTPDMIYRNSVLSAMARIIEKRQMTVASINLDHECKLSLEAAKIAELTAAPTQHKNVLLTGATGFLGRYLLHTLLSLPKVKKVVVLVRNRDLKAAEARLIKAFVKHRFSFEFFDKIELCYGDLARPRLGLSKEAFTDLGAQVDTLYHCGAQVDWVKPYTSLRATNVDGTRTLLELSVTQTLKPLHYISTMWVVNSGADTETYKNYDETHRSDWRGLENGYAQSKWVAEKLVLEAAKLGVPTTSHRMDFIVGSTKTGIIPERDFLVRLVRDAMQLNSVCQEAIHLDVVAVDYLAESIVALCQQPQPFGQVFHHRGAEQLSTHLMSAILMENGLPIQRLPYTDWVTALTADPKSQSWPLKYFLWAYANSPVITDPAHNDTKVVRYDRTIADLAKLGIYPERHHPTARQLFQRLVQHLQVPSEVMEEATA